MTTNDHKGIQNNVNPKNNRRWRADWENTNALKANHGVHKARTRKQNNHWGSTQSIMTNEQSCLSYKQYVVVIVVVVVVQRILHYHNIQCISGSQICCWFPLFYSEWSSAITQLCIASRCMIHFKHPMLSLCLKTSRLSRICCWLHLFCSECSSAITRLCVTSGCTICSMMLHFHRF